MKTNLIFVRGTGAFHKFRGTRGTKMSANADLITVETYVQQGKTINNEFFINGPERDKNLNFLLLGGGGGLGGGASMIRLGNDQMLSSYPLNHIYMYMSNKEAI